MGQIIDSHVMIYLLQGRYIPDLYDLYDLHDLAHVAGWEPYSLHDGAHAPWVGSALYISCTSHKGRLGSRSLRENASF